MAVNKGVEQKGIHRDYEEIRKEFGNFMLRAQGVLEDKSFTSLGVVKNSSIDELEIQLFGHTLKACIMPLRSIDIHNDPGCDLGVAFYTILLDSYIPLLKMKIKHGGEVLIENETAEFRVWSGYLGVNHVIQFLLTLNEACITKMESEFAEFMVNDGEGELSGTADD